MLKWLKDKINKKMSKEMMGCITQNLNFAYAIEVQKYVFKDNIDKVIMNNIYSIKDQTEIIFFKKELNAEFTAEENDLLLRLNKDCRRIWANYFGKSNFKFDKEFPTNEIQYDDFKKLLSNK